LNKKYIVLVSIVAFIFTITSIQATVLNSAIKITFSTNEDYDTKLYGNEAGLREVEEDFKLVKELGLSKLRVSFSWSNYEPSRDQFRNLEWLHKFVDLANEYDIELLPYLCYAPYWATTEGKWNNPPKDYDYWYDFVYKMVSEFKDDIDYWELWNEENAEMWFTGSKEQFAKLLKVGAEAVREADPDAKIIMGGVTYPDFSFVDYMLDNAPNTFDILPIHSYAESWGSRYVEEYIDAGGSSFDGIENILETKGQGQEIWINEIGYPTYGGRTETDQANFIRRAVATLMATEKISLISWYEIKDFKKNKSLGVIGDEINYHLGLSDFNRNKKLAFHTYKNIVSIFHDEEFEYMNDGFIYELKEEHQIWPNIIMHPFRRKADGHIFLYVWLYGLVSETDVDIVSPADIEMVSEYSLNGKKKRYSDFYDNILENLHLVQDEAHLFEIILQDGNL